MSALGMASLGTQCQDKAVGMASLGVFCDLPTPVDVWTEIIRLNLFIQRILALNLER